MTSDTKHDTMKNILMEASPEEISEFSKNAGEVLYSIVQPEVDKLNEAVKTVMEMQNKYSNIYQVLTPSFTQLSDLYLHNLGHYVGLRMLSRKLGKKLRPEIKKKHEGENLSDLELEKMLNKELEVQNSELLDQYSNKFARYLQEEIKKDAYQGRGFLELFQDGAVKDKGDPTQPTFEKDSLIYKAVEAVEKRIQNEQATERREATRKAKVNAKNVGVSLTTREENSNIRSLSSSLFENAMNSIQIRSIEALKNYWEMFDEKGELKTEIPDEQLVPPSSIPTGFFMNIAQLIYSTYIAKGDYDFDLLEVYPSIRFNVSEFFKNASKDVRKGQNSLRPIKEQEVDYIMNICVLCNPWVGITKGRDSKIFKVLSFENYDPATNIIALNAPYLFEIVWRAEQERRANQKQPQFNTMFHANLALKENNVVLEVANAIVVRLLQRGSSKNLKTDKNGNTIVEYTPRFSTIMEICPQLQNRIDSIIDNEEVITDPETGKPQLDENGKEKKRKINVWRKRNQIYKRTFQAAYKMILNDSDAPEHFPGLAIDTSIIPTTGTLGTKMHISYIKKSS